MLLAIWKNRFFIHQNELTCATYFIIIINIPTPLFDTSDTVVLKIIGCVIQILFCFVFASATYSKTCSLKVLAALPQHVGKTLKFRGFQQACVSAHH